jgi:mRNA interferase RelE/StbE
VSGNYDLRRYEVELTPAAERTLRKLDKTIARRLVVAMHNLAIDPRPSGVEALAGHPGALRLLSATTAWSTG